jgi:hypothetical protein
VSRVARLAGPRSAAEVAAEARRRAADDAAELPDTGPAAHPRQRHTTAAEAGMQRPTGVPVSAFDAGRLAKPPRPPRRRLDMAALVFERGVPVPPLHPAAGTSAFDDVVRRLEPGMSVVLPAAHARTLMRAGKRLGTLLTKRTLPGGQVRVWRVAGPPPADGRCTRQAAA